MTNCEGAACHADNILVYGKDGNEQDSRLQQVPRRLCGEEVWVCQKQTSVSGTQPLIRTGETRPYRRCQGPPALLMSGEWWPWQTTWLSSPHMHSLRLSSSQRRQNWALPESWLFALHMQRHGTMEFAAASHCLNLAAANQVIKGETTAAKHSKESHCYICADIYIETVLFMEHMENNVITQHMKRKNSQESEKKNI